MNDTVELTIVMPCLNEEETLAQCIEKAHVGIQRAGVRGEILVADNGSKDNSVVIAEKLGVRVVQVKDVAIVHRIFDCPEGVIHVFQV